MDRDKKRMIYQLEIFSKTGNYRAATTEVCSLYVNLDTRRVTEIEEKKLELMDKFIEENKSNFEPLEFYLLDKLKK